MLKRYAGKTRVKLNPLANRMDAAQQRINLKIRERDPTKALQALKAALEGMVNEHRISAGKPGKPAFIFVTWSMAPSIREHPELTGIVKGADKHTESLAQRFRDNEDRLNLVLKTHDWGDYRANVLYGSNRIAVGMIAKKRSPSEKRDAAEAVF